MGGSYKGQETTSLRSSSSRRDSVSHTHHHHAKAAAANVGCMSGIFHFVSKYHTRRKFLTFGKRQEKQTPSPPPAPNSKPETITCPSLDQGRMSLEVPRSPVIPAEIRRSESGSSPRVVARLMGLDDIPAAEKRRRLLGALEKCDEDLKALKKIIETVRAVQTPPSKAATVVDVGGRREKCKEEEEEEELESEEPSPVSVLDRRHHHDQLLPKSPLTERIRNDVGQVHQQKQKQQREQATMKRPGEEDNASFCFLNKLSYVMATVPPSPYLPTKSRQLFSTLTRRTSMSWSKTMQESVSDVCRDVTWGQRQEVGRIGLIIQDCIYKELIDEVIKEMGSSCHVYSNNLPFEACKRRLWF